MNRVLALCYILISGLYSCKVECDSGYETRNCNVPVRDKFIGSFAGNTVCTTAGTDVDTIRIAPVLDDVTKITISNLTGAGYTVMAAVEPAGSFLIVSQAAGIATIRGNVAIDSGKITITYALTENNSVDNCKWLQQ